MHFFLFLTACNNSKKVLKTLGEKYNNVHEISLIRKTQQERETETSVSYFPVTEE